MSFYSHGENFGQVESIRITHKVPPFFISFEFLSIPGKIIFLGSEINNMSLEEIYGYISESIVDAIPEPWKMAVLNIEMLANYRSFTAHYYDLNSEKKYILTSVFDAKFSQQIKELHKLTTDAENSKWNKAVFSISEDHNFEMELVWDQEFQNKMGF